MRAVRRTLLIIAILLVVVVALLVATPVGWRVGLPFARRSLHASTGLELAVGGVGGRPLGRLVLSDVELTDPDAGAIASVAELDAHYSLVSILRGAPVIHELSISDADVLLDAGSDGALVGWRRFASGDTAAAADGDAASWSIGEGHLSDVAVRYVDEAAGTRASVWIEEAEASGDQDELDVRLEATVRGKHAAVTDSVRARLDGAARYLPGRIEIESLTLLASGAREVDDAVSLTVSGTLPFTPDGLLALWVDAEVDAGRALPLVSATAELPRGSGVLRVTGELDGRWTAFEWNADVAADAVVYAGVAGESLAVVAAGEPERVVVDHVALHALGGALEAEGLIDLPRSGSASGAGAETMSSQARLRASGAFLGVDLGEIPGSTLGGAADVRFGGAMDGGALATLAATLDVETRRLTVPAKQGEGVSVGRLVAHGEAGEGVFTLTARGLAASAEVHGELAEDGPRSVTAYVETDSLAATVGAFAEADVSGTLRVEARADHPMQSLEFTAEARAESLAFGTVTIGAATATAAGRPDDMSGRLAAFDGAVNGTWNLADGDLGARVTLDSLDVSGEFASDTRAPVVAEATATGEVDFLTRRGGGFDASATLTELSVAAGSESLHIVRPVTVVASEDSVRVRDLVVLGTPGGASLDGVFAARSGMRLDASLDDLRLEAVEAMLGGVREESALHGTVAGKAALRLERADESPARLTLDATLETRELVASGVRLGDIRVDARSVDSAVAVDLSGRSDAGGTVRGSARLPFTLQDEGLPTLDAGREFEASVACSSYVLEGGPSFLSQIRGRKLFTITGGASVAGRADSLETLRGTGRFEGAEAAWGFVSFSLAEPFDFSVEGRAVAVDSLTVEIARRRALGEEPGGTVSVSGGVDAAGALDVALRTTELDVAHLMRALMPGTDPVLTGTLTADAAVGGTLGEPSVSFSWDLARPTIAGVRFDSLTGSGSADAYALELDPARLSLDGSDLIVSGVFPLQRAQGPPLYPGMYAGVRELDLAIRAYRFRLNRTKGLPDGVKRLEAVIEADLRLTGAVEAPDVQGDVVLSGGRVELVALEQPIRDVRLRVTGTGGSARLEEAFARIGSGSIRLDGELSTSGGGRGFELRAEVDGVDVTIPDVADALIDGELEWSGTPVASTIRGDVGVDKATVTYKVNLSEVLARRPRAVVTPVEGTGLDRIGLDITANLESPLEVDSNIAIMELTGGVRAGGSLARPSLSGGVSADAGIVRYLGQEFEVRTFAVRYTDPRRRVPFVDVVATADVESGAGELYTVTVRYQGFGGEAVPELSSVPPLSEPDIVALLTFGQTMGGLTSGSGSGSAGESFSSLARSAFISGLYGVAEATAKRWLNLDTVDVITEEGAEGGLADAQVTVGKRFGRRLSVDYTTDLGGFEGQTVGLSWRMTDTISIETKANQEGNHAIGVKFRFRLE